MRAPARKKPTGNPPRNAGTVVDVRFDAAAIADVTPARDWYEGEGPGLGREFVDCVEATARCIGLFPYAGSVTH